MTISDKLFGEDPLDGKLHVHVDNTNDFAITRTEEKEPEHFTFGTYVINPAGGQYADGSPSGYAQISIDLARKSLSLLNVNSFPIILCHNLAQVKDPSNYGASIVNPSGALIPAGGSAGMDGTGGLFIVNTSTSANALVTVIVNRRGNA